MLAWLSSMIGGALVKTLGNAILRPVFDYLNRKSDAEVEKLRTVVGAERDVLIAQLQANVMAQETRAQLLMAQWGRPEIRFIIMLIAIPASLHWGAIMLDSMPFYIPFFMSEAHIVGSWKVSELPQPYDGYQWLILQSFFVLAPVQVAAGALVRKWWK